MAEKSQVVDWELTGYQITYLDLGRLVIVYPSGILAIVTERLGLRAISSRNTLEFRDAAAVAIPLQQVHARAQADPAVQYDLYQFAKSQWR